MANSKKIFALSVFFLLLNACNTTNDQTSPIKEELNIKTTEPEPEKTEESPKIIQPSAKNDNNNYNSEEKKENPNSANIAQNNSNPNSELLIPNAHYQTIREISKNDFEQAFGKISFFNIDDQPIGAEEIYSSKISGTNILAVNTDSTAYIIDVTLYSDDQAATEAYNKIIYEKITPELTPVEIEKTTSENASKSYARFGDEQSYGYALITRDYNALIIVNKTPPNPPPLDENLKNDLAELSNFVYQYL